MEVMMFKASRLHQTSNLFKSNAYLWEVGRPAEPVFVIHIYLWFFGSTFEIPECVSCVLVLSRLSNYTNPLLSSPVLWSLSQYMLSESLIWKFCLQCSILFPGQEWCTSNFKLGIWNVFVCFVISLNTLSVLSHFSFFTLLPLLHCLLLFLIPVRIN